MSKKLTTEDFIKRAKEVHGDKYDYSKVKYERRDKNVIIIDKEDGSEFLMTPACHLSGQDNPKRKWRKLNQAFSLGKDKFIERAKKIHGDKYDYSKVEYVNNRKKVCIVCPEHGEFWQAPDKHLQGRGCPKCCKKNRKYTLEEFIARAKEIHGDKYDYSKVVYVDNKTRVCIICPEHGEFWQTPVLHLQGSGCKYCKKGLVFNTEDFKKRARKIHGDKYDYSKVVYRTAYDPVKIICPEHGEFLQKPVNHLNKEEGCPECGKKFRQGENELFRFLCEKYPETEIIHSFWIGKREYDIFFPQFKIGVEFQGAQHFKPVDFGGYGEEKAKELFVENQERDRKKKEFSKKKDITLLYFSDLIKYDTFLGEKLYHDKEELYEVIKQIVKKETES